MLRALWVLAVPAVAAADPWGVDVSVGGTADSEVAASAHAGARWWYGLRSSDPGLELALRADLDRVPWLTAARELSPTPYSAATAQLRAPCKMTRESAAEWGNADFVEFPIEMTVGVLAQGDQQRKVGGGRATAMNMCWINGDEPTCVGWFGGGGSEIRDELRKYGALVVYFAPVTGLPLGPVRVDAELGLASATRELVATQGMPELSVTAFRWNVRARTHIRELALSIGSRREPYASSDGALSFEDRAEAAAAYAGVTATAYVARTRWWIADAMPVGVADTIGGELAYAARFAGFDIHARGAVGRSFYTTTSDGLRDPAFGARLTVDIERTFALH